jgi:hypothetical protein
LLWRKTFTGLSPAGNRLVNLMAQEHFEPAAHRIAGMLNHYLRTDRILAMKSLAKNFRIDA